MALFEALRAEYEKAKEVTRARLYLEAMEQILPGVGSILIVDPDATGVLSCRPARGDAEKPMGCVSAFFLCPEVTKDPAPRRIRFSRASRRKRA